MAEAAGDDGVTTVRAVGAPAQHRARVAGPPARGAPAEARQTCNEVHLVGRLAAPAEERELPSGDVLVTFRVAVDRPPPHRPVPAGVRTPSVDSLPCVAWPPSVRRSVSSWAAGDLVEVSGALRRRFWRSERGAASMVEVEVTSARRLAHGAGTRR